MVKSFQDLIVWQKAHALALDVYCMTNSFPRSERFGIVAQVRRSASSVPANIAESFGRRSTKEFLQSLGIANGSLEETRYFLILSRDLRFLPPGEFHRLDEQCTSVAQMLAALVRSLKNRALNLSALPNAAEAQAADHGSRNADHGSHVSSKRVGSV